MRKTAFAGLFACVIFAAGSPAASAETLGLLKTENLFGANNTVSDFLAQLSAQTTEPKERYYTVAKNDTLEDIAELHNTTWKQLFYKNTELDHPDVIAVGTKLVIPDPTENLEARPLPELAQEQEPPNAAVSRSGNESQARQATTKLAALRRGSASGNRYVPGYCTWYAKNKRSDLPNNLGNANTWVARARAQGIPTGSAPRAGAIGQRGMHVVYVESVNPGGTVTISEMNRRSLYAITRRTVPASHFTYIY